MAKGGADVVGRRECEVEWRDLPRASSTGNTSMASEGFVACIWSAPAVGPASIWICAVLYESHLYNISNEFHYDIVNEELTPRISNRANGT